MRNGLNISGLSEFVHEIERDPEEGVLAFRVETEPDGDRATAHVRTCRFGTTRMARDFTVPQGPRHLSPYETAFAAFGACLLMTHVNGFTARAVSLSSLRVRVTATPDHDTWTVAYDIDVDADCDDDTLRSVTLFASALSPNHRLLVDDAEVDGLSATLSVREEPLPAVRADLRWEYGMETWATTSLDGGVAHTLVLDQGKQMLGIDRAPNPQETLLAAIGAELALRHGVRVCGTGRLDARGANNVPGIPVRFHGLRLDVDGPVAASPLLRLVCAANTARIFLRRNDTEVDELVSSRAQAEEFLRSMTAAK
ncbi:hypothetical protein Lesp02_35270 [Lentzea sp. NBRC 105346]|uniref:OsmC family protein n=1 Tax=Lentzea sp. NBRC 105346 TaxID=3032205 RepID=UPI0024A461DA|nr:hypothetical protein [Lentzea sp. NBRC 105346]GLZ31339.1 hypothetical protein Lesp02_35270 [Lentzea sp. NBRC 105346]